MCIEKPTAKIPPVRAIAFGCNDIAHGLQSYSEGRNSEVVYARGGRGNSTHIAFEFQGNWNNTDTNFIFPKPNLPDKRINRQLFDKPRTVLGEGKVIRFTGEEELI